METVAASCIEVAGYQIIRQILGCCALCVTEEHLKCKRLLQGTSGQQLQAPTKRMQTAATMFGPAWELMQNIFYNITANAPTCSCPTADSPQIMLGGQGQSSRQQTAAASMSRAVPMKRHQQLQTAVHPYGPTTRLALSAMARSWHHRPPPSTPACHWLSLTSAMGWRSCP